MDHEPIFVSEGDEFVPTGHATSPWAPDALHGGAPAALLVRAVESVPTIAPMQVARLSYDLLGPVPAAPLGLDAEIAKEGKRTQLVSARLRAGEHPVMRLTALRIRRADVVGIVADEASEVPGPPAASDSELPFPAAGPAFHATAMDIRIVAGDFVGPGPATAWFRLRRPLVDGETPTPLQRLAAAADFGNGISWVLPKEEYLFTNPDLTVHLAREPVGEWIALDARTLLGGEGAGLAESALHDRRGRLGRSVQSLYLDRQ